MRFNSRRNFFVKRRARKCNESSANARWKGSLGCCVEHYVSFERANVLDPAAKIPGPETNSRPRAFSLASAATRALTSDIRSTRICARDCWEFGQSCRIHRNSFGFGPDTRVAAAYPTTVYHLALRHLYFLFTHFEAAQLLTTGAHHFPCRNVHSSRTAAADPRCMASGPV